MYHALSILDARLAGMALDNTARTLIPNSHATVPCQAIYHGDGRLENCHSNSQSQNRCDRDGEDETGYPADQPDDDTFHNDDLLDITVRCSYRPHDTDLAGAFHHIDAHGAHHTHTSNNGDEDGHDQQEIHQQVGGIGLLCFPFGSLLNKGDLDLIFFEYLVADPSLLWFDLPDRADL